MGTEMLITVVIQKIDDTKWYYTVDEKYTNKFSMRQNEVKKKKGQSAHLG